jgi:hypothetical protein
MKELQVRLRPHVFFNIFFPDVRRPPDAFELELADVSFQQFIYFQQKLFIYFNIYLLISPFNDDRGRSTSATPR